MKKKKDEKSLINYIKGVEKRNYWRLTNTKLVFLLVGTVIILILVSFILFECHPWLSNVLISAGCGIFTGLLLYFLTNKRANISAKIQIEYDRLKKLDCLLKEIINIGWHYKFNVARIVHEHRNLHEDVSNILLILTKLGQVNKDIFRELWHSVGYPNDAPLCEDKIKDMIDGSEIFVNNDDLRKWIVDIYDTMIPIADNIHQPIQDREYQLTYLNKSVF